VYKLFSNIFLNLSNKSFPVQWIPAEGEGTVHLISSLNLFVLLERLRQFYLSKVTENRFDPRRSRVLGLPFQLVFHGPWLATPLSSLFAWKDLLTRINLEQRFLPHFCFISFWINIVAIIVIQLSLRCLKRISWVCHLHRNMHIKV